MSKQKSQTIIYQTKTGAIELRQDANAETVWATQADIANIFDVERSVITKHINNILKDKELNKKSVRAKMARTADDSKTYQVQFYNLDVILAVGYRTNSTRAIVFRQWATKTLKEHIQKGYTINRQRIKANYDDFLKAIADVKNLLPVGSSIDNQQVIELITLFADTWFSLDAYDRDKLVTKGATKKKVGLTADKLTKALFQKLVRGQKYICLVGFTRAIHGARSSGAHRILRDLIITQSVIIKSRRGCQSHFAAISLI